MWSLRLITVLVSVIAVDAFSSSPSSLRGTTVSSCTKRCRRTQITTSRGSYAYSVQSSLRSASIRIEDDNSQQTQNPSATPFVGLPSYRRILFFVSTTVLIWISEPLLSLVDSAVVGRYAGRDLVSTSTSGPNLSSVAQLASLGPATMLCDSSIYLTFFIAMATTNKLATSFAKKDVEEQITTISHVMAISLAVGSFLCLIINVFGEGLLSSILGPAGSTVAISSRGGEKVIDLTNQVLHAALGYARIRCAVYPLAVMGLTSQAALLCSGDTKTPVLAVLVASLTNIVGDYLFVAKCGFGVRGAALATSLASLMSNGILVSRLWKTVQGWKNNLQTQSIEGSLMKEQNQVALRLPFIAFPDRESFLSLVRLAGPMFFVLCGKVMGYSAMTVRAGTYGLVSLACHNILMRIFFFFATVGDGLSHATQTFMPGLLYQKSQVEEQGTKPNDINVAQNARTLLKRVLLMSTAVGAVNSVVSKYIANNAGSAFTTDTSLVSLMSNVSPFMGLALFIHPITMTLEGSIIAGRNLRRLLGTYVLSVILLLAQLNFVCDRFVGVWHALLFFQAIRIVQFGPLVWRRTASKVS
jgi:Na+-driven multidrug efflux pump